MIEKFKNEVNKYIHDIFEFKEVKGKKYKILKTNCVKNKNHYMYYKNGKFSCPICGYSNKDLVELYSEIFNMDQYTILEKLFKIKLKKDTTPIIKEKEKNKYENEILRLINYDAMLFFKEQLRKNKDALKYLYDRGLTDETIEKFNLGYAPKYNKLLRTLSKDFNEEDLLKAGIIGYDDKHNKYYDMFKDRIIFPIINRDNEIISFGGRTLADSSKKYINTKNTPIFKKSNNLYALNMINFVKANKNGKLKRVFVCEGYMDVIAMHQAGIDCVVGTLGTALTPTHYNILKEISEQIVIIYDGDEAGIKAVERTLEKVGNLDILILPNGLDPDEYIKKYGKDNFLEFIDKNIQSSIDYWMKQYNNYKGNVFEYLFKHIKDL